VTAYGRRSRKMRCQALVEFVIGRDIFEGVLMISPHITREATCQHLKGYRIDINFERGSSSYDREDFSFPLILSFAVKTSGSNKFAVILVVLGVQVLYLPLILLIYVSVMMSPVS
jgi:hypothetical protein